MSCLGQEEAVGEQRHRTRLGAELGDRVQQQLQRGQPNAVVARRQRHHGGEVASRAVAANCHPVAIGAEFGGVVERPPVCGVAVRHRGGRLVFRCQPVVDRQHVHARVAADQSAQAIVGFDAPDREATAMEEDEKRCGALPLRVDRHVVPRPNGARRTGNRHLRHPDRDGGIDDRRQFAQLRAGRRQVAAGDESVEAGRPLGGEQQLQRGVQRVAVDDDGAPTKEQPLDRIGNLRQGAQRDAAGCVDNGKPGPARTAGARMRHRNRRSGGDILGWQTLRHG